MHNNLALSYGRKILSLASPMIVIYFYKNYTLTHYYIHFQMIKSSQSMNAVNPIMFKIVTPF